MSRFTVKDIALIASLSAIVILSGMIYMVYFMLIVLTLSVKKVHMHLIALISAILNWWIWSSADLLLINILFWPLLVLIIQLSSRYIFNVKKGEALVVNDKSRRIALFIVSLVAILFINLLGAYINGLLFSTVEAALMTGLWFFIIQGFISALLILFFGFYLQKRIQLLLERFSS